MATLKQSGHYYDKDNISPVEINHFQPHLLKTARTIGMEEEESSKAEPSIATEAMIAQPERQARAAPIKHKSKRLRRIARSTGWEILSKNNLIFIVVVALLGYFLGLYLKLESNKSEWEKIIDFYSRVQGAFMEMNEIGQSFMQEAME